MGDEICSGEQNEHDKNYYLNKLQIQQSVTLESLNENELGCDSIETIDMGEQKLMSVGSEVEAFVQRLQAD